MPRTPPAILAWLVALSTVLTSSTACSAQDGEDPAWQEDLEALRATIESMQDEEARVRISGTERVRVMNIRSDSEVTTGPYGEVLRRGNSVRYRLGLRIEASVTRSLTAGGWLRLSNEGREILTQGPDYLSLERGSAFVRYVGENLRLTTGYYPIHWTPFTLMRWDLEDNPQGGGSMACAVCGTAVGLLNAESLEELGPTLTFEGARGEISVGGVLDLTALYANPNRAQDSLFHRDLWACRTVFHVYGPGGTGGTLGATYLRADDDETSFPTKAAVLPEIETELVGFDGQIRLGGPATLTGEWVRTHALKAFGKRHGEAYIVGARTLLLRRRFSASVHYIHIDPTFRSPYAALSYLANREGIRVSAGWRSRRERARVTVFYKKLEEVEREFQGADPTAYTTWGFGAGVRPVARLSLEGDVILDREKRYIPAASLWYPDAKKTTAVVDLVYELGALSEVRARYQATDSEDRFEPDRSDLTHLTSLQWTVEF